MAEVAAAVTAFHDLLQSAEYEDLGWAERLQEEMRRRGLTDSGRLLNPVIRPHFATRAQLNRLGAVSSWLFDAMSRLEPAIMQSPALINRLRLLPAEKALASASCSPRRSVAAALTASLENGAVSVRGIDTGLGAGLAYSDLLADLFLMLPIMRDFDRLGYRPEKCGSIGHLLCRIQNAWRESGGREAPAIGILELKNSSAATEGALLAELFRSLGAPAELVHPEPLEFSNGKLRAGRFVIDVVLRRVETRDLLLYCELEHPLFRAYREGAVCVLNDFRVELWQRRAALELLTDPGVCPDCDGAGQCVPWTRFVSARKTVYRGECIDLLPFLTKNRERFVLLPNDPRDGAETFIGAEMTAASWDRAMRIALQRPYVAQEYAPKPLDAFPVFRYSQLEVQNLAVTVMASVLDGKIQGASAALESVSGGSGCKVGIAPVLAIV